MPRETERGSLFERLMHEARPYRSLTRHEKARHRISAIKHHLECVLNARRGSSQSSPELGLGDFNGNSLGSNDLLVHIGADIQRSVEVFEPRLRVLGVQLHSNPDLPLELNFRLDCQVRLDNREEQLLLDVAMNGRNQYIRVR